MIDTAYVKGVVDHTILVIRFSNDADIGLAFAAVLDETNGQLDGLSLYYVRKSTKSIRRVATKVITDLFRPQLTAVARPKTYALQMRPLTDPITIVQRSRHKFICQYPFKDQGKRGKLTHVDVCVSKPPLSIQFKLCATYRRGRHSRSETLTSVLSCPEAFTRDLFAIASHHTTGGK